MQKLSDNFRLPLALNEIIDLVVRKKLVDMSSRGLSYGIYMLQYEMF